MTKRRPITLHDTGLDRFAAVTARTHQHITLGWTLLRNELADAGWPARTPDNDGTPAAHTIARCTQCGERFTHPDGPRFHHDNTGHDQTIWHDTPERSIDYADPTGDQAAHISRLHRDLEAMQTATRELERAWARLEQIAARHRQLAPAAPLCTRAGCDNLIEKGRDGYRGCEEITGIWVVREGGEDMAVCSFHRKVTARSESAA